MSNQEHIDEQGAELSPEDLGGVSGGIDVGAIGTVLVTDNSNAIATGGKGNNPPVQFEPLKSFGPRNEKS